MFDRALCRGGLRPNGAGDDSLGGEAVDAAGGDTSNVAATPPGGSCSCDADCQGVDNHEGVCIYGVCMTKASAKCSAGGSTAECPTGSQCWNLSGQDGSLCWPECATYTCAGTCASDGTCEPNAQTDCDPTCGQACSCTASSCGTGDLCVNGECVPDVGPGPGAGPGPTCSSLPARDCTTNCGTLVTFSPRTNSAWDDYAINGETASSQYRSYLRRDLMQLVAWATSKTSCKSAQWTTGNGGALGLGDMSEANGAIPGTAVGEPGHPQGTHTNGYDIDLGYYQIGTADNRLRPICAHTSGGQDQYHCTEDPTYLDIWRHALFLGFVFESTRTRVIGVDGKAGPKLALCDQPAVHQRLAVVGVVQQHPARIRNDEHEPGLVLLPSSPLAHQPQEGVVHRSIQRLREPGRLRYDGARDSAAADRHPPRSAGEVVASPD